LSLGEAVHTAIIAYLQFVTLTFSDSRFTDPAKRIQDFLVRNQLRHCQNLIATQQTFIDFSASSKFLNKLKNIMGLRIIEL